MIKIRKDDSSGPSSDRPRKDTRDSGRPPRDSNRDTSRSSDGPSRPRRDDSRDTSRNSDRPNRPQREDSRGPRKFEKRGGNRDGRDFFGRKPERPVQDEDAPGKSDLVAGHRYTDISDIDGQILGLLEKRAFLIRKEGAWRKSRQKSLVDPKLEKLLRGSFDQMAGDAGLDAKLSKQLFTLLNQFSLADIRQKFEGEGYKLAPRVDHIKAGIAGPRSFRYTRMMLAMAASSGTQIKLAPVTMNAPNKDLAKALKQVGAPITWDDDWIRNEGGKTLEFEGNMAFVGEDPFNFYMLLCLALGHAGRCKFTGKPALQLLDASALNKVLPSLGARLVPMNPNNPGLPVRLECGGFMDEAVTLPGSLDPDFAAALTLAAWSFPGGLTIQGLTSDARDRVAEAVEVLTACGITAKLEKDSVTVSDGVPTMDHNPRLPLSVRLNSLLMALPILSGGSINIEGSWPKNDQADRVLAQLKALGLRVDVATENVFATMEGELPESADITLGNSPDFMPLALALALKIGNARISGADNDVAVELLDRLGASYELADDVIELKAGTFQWDGTWFSPDPIWSMGCALAAYSVPGGIVLENHGEVTATWPEFWNFYNSLPTGVMKPKPVREIKDDSRKRIKIR
ncbi:MULTISPECIES: chorismate mutase [unclassified Pseudodesulfovibrio]|uniref:chorismate mutase n=1 Tax=unclassified Pseudodesulfovibrio TaxID=2661612 RepID=UPI000FEC044F|nr:MULTISPECIES: chorismate mutase [unclassified Pseudodesulfovibrio]MCJ2165507.1 chorismate mutase [Pseudodesulfovibrio sp. S3-i]RWU03128.1 chorismate mutase [Pseudodesulfovibrio sp. S3]